MMRLGVKRSRKSALLGLCALVIVLIVVNVFKRRHESDKEPLKPPESSHTDTADLLSVFDFHCNTVQTLKNKRLPQSAEGNFPETDQYEIQQVQVVTRHGDRAAIFSTPMTHFNRFQCPGSDYFDKTARLAQVRCRKAQLTKTGCEQHQTLGEHFRKAYDFSVDIDELKLKMTVRSTKYQRTITSALCFMNGLLGDRSFTKGQIIIHSSDVFRDNPFVDTGFETQCPRLNSIWAKSKTRPAYVSASKRWDHIRRRAINFVASSENQLQRPSLSLTAIGDNIYTHFCHLRNSMGDESITPCVRPGFCLPVTLAGDILRAFDECTTFNYTEEVSLLLIQPLLAQIVAQMELATLGKSGQKFILYSGHDVTLAPILIALGEWDGLRSPYASRIVFELWKKKDSNGEHRVRVLYNGKRMGQMGRGGIPLGEFKQSLLSGRLRTTDSYRKACMRGIV